MSTHIDVDVLLVDDDPSDVELALYALRKDKPASSIHVVEDGKEALDFVFCRGKYEGRSRLDRPKVILLDLKLPKVDGLGVLRAIKNDANTKATPVVILTSSREQKDLIEGYRSGASAYIQKPVNFDEFRQKIRQIGMFWLSVNEPPPHEAFDGDS
jgi:two-component system response regulator